MTQAWDFVDAAILWQRERQGILYTPIADIDWGLQEIRIINSLKWQNITTVYELVQQTERELLLIANFGRKSLDEVKSTLAKHNLHLGMTLS